MPDPHGPRVYLTASDNTQCLGIVYLNTQCLNASADTQCLGIVYLNTQCLKIHPAYDIYMHADFWPLRTLGKKSAQLLFVCFVRNNNNNK